MIEKSFIMAQHRNAMNPTTNDILQSLRSYYYTIEDVMNNNTLATTDISVQLSDEKVGIAYQSSESSDTELEYESSEEAISTSAEEPSSATDSVERSVEYSIEDIPSLDFLTAMTYKLDKMKFLWDKGGDFPVEETFEFRLMATTEKCILLAFFELYVAILLQPIELAAVTKYLGSYATTRVSEATTVGEEYNSTNEEMRISDTTIKQDTIGDQVITTPSHDENVEPMNTVKLASASIDIAADDPVNPSSSVIPSKKRTGTTSDEMTSTKKLKQQSQWCIIS